MAAENDIETKAERMAGHRRAPVKQGYQAMSSFIVWNAIKNRIEWQQRISGKIHLRDQAREQPGSEERKVNVGRAPGIGVILPRVSTRFYGNQTVIALAIRQHASAAREIRVERRAMLIHAMAIASRRIGLPDFDQRSGNRASLFIQDTPAHNDAFSDGFAAMLPSEVIIVLADVAMAEDRATKLRQGVREQDQGPFWESFARGSVGGVIVIWLGAVRCAPITDDSGHGIGENTDSNRRRVSGQGRIEPQHEGQSRAGRVKAVGYV